MMTGQRDYMTDTHPFIWYLDGQFRRMGRSALAMLQAADAGEGRIFVPAVVLAEMLMVVEKRRVSNTSMSFLLSQFERMAASRNYALLPLAVETVIESHQVSVIPDIFDRLIATEAIELGLPLLTRDPVFAREPRVRTMWD